MANETHKTAMMAAATVLLGLVVLYMLRRIQTIEQRQRRQDKKRDHNMTSEDAQALKETLGSIREAVAGRMQQQQDQRPTPQQLPQQHPHHQQQLPHPPVPVNHPYYQHSQQQLPQSVLTSSNGASMPSAVSSQPVCDGDTCRVVRPTPTHMQPGSLPPIQPQQPQQSAAPTTFAAIHPVIPSLLPQVFVHGITYAQAPTARPIARAAAHQEPAAHQGPAPQHSSGVPVEATAAAADESRVRIGPSASFATNTHHQETSGAAAAAATTDTAGGSPKIVTGVIVSDKAIAEFLQHESAATKFHALQLAENVALADDHPAAQAHHSAQAYSQQQPQLDENSADQSSDDAANNDAVSDENVERDLDEARKLSGMDRMNESPSPLSVAGEESLDISSSTSST